MGMPTVEPMVRQGYCRACDEVMSPGNLAIKLYSRRNRGQNILFCLDCAEIIGDLSLVRTKEEGMYQQGDPDGTNN